MSRHEFNITNRINKFLAFERAAPTSQHPPLPDLYAGDGQYVDVDISSESGLLTVRWEDANERHRVTYSMAIGLVMVWNTTPLESA